MDRIKDFDRELDALYAAISGRGPFRYQADSDPLYRSYAQRYLESGRRAMTDTMGRAAGLTGGYGSSYAQAVGQQQYDRYLQDLAQVLPELYGMAWQQYQEEGRGLEKAYDLVAGRRDQAVKEGRQAEQDAWRRSQGLWQQEQSAQEEERRREQQDYDRRQDSYRQLSQLISQTGYVPGDAELSGAGMSREQAQALRSAWELKQKPQGTGRTVYYIRSGGKEKSDSSGSDRSSGGKSPVQPVKTAGGGGGRRSDSLY